MSVYREMAEKIAIGLKRSYSGPLLCVPALERDFEHLDLPMYGRFRQAMAARGFTSLADVEMPELSARAPVLFERALIRCMLSEDGIVLASCHHMKPRMRRWVFMLVQGLLHFRFIQAPAQFMRGTQQRHGVEFQTGFDDGSFLSTSNIVEAAAIAVPPSIDRKIFARDAPWTEMLDHHLARSRAIMAEKGVTPLVMRTFGDTVRFAERQKSQKDAYRASVAWITQEELQRLAHGDDRLADAVYAEVQKLLAEQASACVAA